MNLFESRPADCRSTPNDLSAVIRDVSCDGAKVASLVVGAARLIGDEYPISEEVVSPTGLGRQIAERLEAGIAWDCVGPGGATLK